MRPVPGQVVSIWEWLIECYRALYDVTYQQLQKYRGMQIWKYLCT